MNNDFIWQDEVNFCGVVIRFAILKFNNSGKFGACVAQIFGDEFVMVAASTFNDIQAAKNYLLDYAIEINLAKLFELRSDLDTLLN